MPLGDPAGYLPSVIKKRIKAKGAKPYKPRSKRPPKRADGQPQPKPLPKNQNQGEGYARSPVATVNFGTFERASRKSGTRNANQPRKFRKRGR